MSGLDLTVRWALGPVMSRLERLRKLRTRKLLSQLGDSMVEQSRERIDETHDGPNGEKWQEWSDSYARSKKPKVDLLHASGDLMDDISKAIGKDSVTVGSDLIYALVQQDGDEERNIPDRPYLGVSKEDLEELGEATLAFVAEEVFR